MPGHKRAVLARAGIGSRRACEEFVAAGRVSVNGEIAALGRRVDTERDRVTLDGVPVPTRPGLVYYLLNKPRGVITTAADPQGRPTVVDLVPSEPRVVPAGRLDADTEGLLVLTNDGDLIFALTHPSRGVEKTYLVEVTGTPSRGAIRALREGVDLDAGLTAPARAALVQEGPGFAALEITIHEGRNHQVRRMCEAVGHPVRRLVRTRIGRLADPSLKPGEWRIISGPEVRSLYEAGGVEGAE
ncbi:MAG: rRNA pseudouridine synthase [Actinobacteria bacterium]|nr:rRNA pseudouridine synthase [Actinomycetota bacterium]